MCKYLFFLPFVTLCIVTQAQEFYRTKVMREDIRSLEIKVQGEVISTPFIELNGEKPVEIIFDALYSRGSRFVYSVIHCDADWKKSRLISIDYMSGFHQTPIDDYANASGTTTHYTNYRLTLPNENTQLTVSGNYAIQIFEEDAPSKVVLTACFSVVETLVDIDAGVSGNTDIDFNKQHQQVEFVINPQNLS